MKAVAVALFALATAARPAAAQGPPVHTDTPITLGLEGRAVSSFLKVARASVGGAEVRMTAWPVMVPFSLSARGVVGIMAPVVSQEVEVWGRTMSSGGLGDVALSAKYVVVQVDRHRQTLRLAPKVVVKLPTGDEDEAPALGTGTYDLSAGAVGAWLRGRLGLYAEGLYAWRGESRNRQLGNGLDYNLALGWRALPAVYHTYPARQVNAYLELNGAWRARDRLQGREVAASGGHVLLGAPGIQYVPLRWFLVEASLQLPLLRDLNGPQPELDWTATAGVRALAF